MIVGTLLIISQEMMAVKDSSACFVVNKFTEPDASRDKRLL
jgi:hypothetical protein